MATKARGWGGDKGLSDRPTRKRTFLQLPYPVYEFMNIGTSYEIMGVEKDFVFDLI